MNALSKSPVERLSSAPEAEALSSPDSHHPSDGFTIEISDLMLPASALESELFGIPAASSATVVSTGSYDEMQESTPPVAVVTTSRPSKQRKLSASERRHSLPSSLMLSQSPFGEAVTQPVPEFLCHLFSMLRDPSYLDLISWSVPTHDEPDHMGGGIRNIGKIVVHKPEALQDFVLGKYYRHSKYASFQRQLNYFGFKKRLHGGKKGKLSPCSYIHESLNEDVGSLFTLKRRPPAKKRTADDIDCAASVSSIEDKSISNKNSNSHKRRCVSPKKKSKKSKKVSSKKDKKKQQGKQLVVGSSMSIQVQTEEFSPSLAQSSAPIVESKQYQAQTVPSMVRPVRQVSASIESSPAVAQQQSNISASSAECQLTLLELLSTSLPSIDILFNEHVDSVDDEGVPAWVTDDGKYHYHNVDSSLVDLAMLY